MQEMDAVTLRPAGGSDLMYFFKLKTDPQAARMSRRAPPDMDQHLRWWTQTSDYRYVAEVRGLPVGIVRVAVDGILSIVVDPGYRGTGLGTKMLEAIVPVARSQGFKKLYAEVAPENLASQRAFGKAAWRPTMFEVNT